MSKWTPEQVTLLKQLYHTNLRSIAIASHVGHTVRAIEQKAQSLGLGPRPNAGNPKGFKRILLYNIDVTEDTDEFLSGY